MAVPVAVAAAVSMTAAAAVAGVRILVPAAAAGVFMPAAAALLRSPVMMPAAAGGRRGVNGLERSGDECFHRRVGRSCCAGIKADARLRKRGRGPASNAAADDGVHIVLDK